jgi:hypothetical protein
VTLIRLRGGTEAEWTDANPVIMAREVGVTTDTHRLKVGDGVTEWNDLPYVDEAGAAADLTLADDDVTLPAAGILGRGQTIKHVGTAPITVSAADLIDGQPTLTLYPQEALTVIDTGLTWVIV